MLCVNKGQSCFCPKQTNTTIKTAEYCSSKVLKLKSKNIINYDKVWRSYWVNKLCILLRGQSCQYSLSLKQPLKRNFYILYCTSFCPPISKHIQTPLHYERTSRIFRDHTCHHLVMIKRTKKIPTRHVTYKKLQRIFIKILCCLKNLLSNYC